MTKEYLTKEVAKKLKQPHWKITLIASKNNLGYVKYGKRFLNEEHIKFIEHKLTPKYTHCVICGKPSNNRKYHPGECLQVHKRRLHYQQKKPCKICGKITHKKYCCASHKRQGFEKYKKGFVL